MPSNRLVRDACRSIAEQLLEPIEVREHKSRLPAERHLAAEFGVSRDIIHDAFNLLDESKIIVRRAGSGSFVHASSPKKVVGVIDPCFKQSINATSKVPWNMRVCNCSMSSAG